MSRADILKCGVALFVLSGGTAGQACAQTTASTKTSTEPLKAAAVSKEEQAGSDRLGDILVTARRRSESLQQVPIAVSAFDSTYLDQHQITNSFQLTSISPSLQIQSINSQVGAVNFSVRGVGTAVYGPQIESSVAIVIDDVAMGRPQFGVLSFFDIDRVEVLRGPQGMLFGKNASAGLVNIVTGQPRLGISEYRARVEYGNMNSGGNGNSAKVDVVGNVPIGEDAALRISGFVNRDDSYVRNIFRHENLGFTEYGARAKLLWQPTSGVKLTLAGDYAHENGPAESVLNRRLDAAGGLIQALNARYGIVASPNNLSIATDAPTSNYFNLYGVSLKAEMELGGGYALTNIASYRNYRSKSELDTDSLPVDGLNINTQKFFYWQASDELRLSSPSEQKLSYQLGLYYLRLSARNEVTQLGNLIGAFGPPPAGGSVVGSFFTPNSQTESVAAFFEGKYALTARLRVTAGIRYTHDDLSYHVGRTQATAANPLNPVGFSAGSQKLGNVSYRAGLDFSITDSVLAYATYSRGYKGPTFDQLTATPVGKEIPISYEVGLKSTLFDRKLRLNLSLYDTTFHGFQAQARANGPTTAFQTVNAGDLKARGVEVEFTALPVPHLTLSGGVAYNHARYVGFSGVGCYDGQVQGTSGTNVCLPDGTQDVSGNQLLNAPRWTSSVTVRYDRDVSSSLNAFVQSDVNYRSAFNYTATRDPRTQIGENAIVGASVGLESRNNGWTLTAFVRNLTDRRIPTFIIADPLSAVYTGSSGKTDSALGGNVFQQFGASSFRTIGIAATLKI